MNHFIQGTKDIPKTCMTQQDMQACEKKGELVTDSAPVKVALQQHCFTKDLALEFSSGIQARQTTQSETRFHIGKD